MEDFISEDDLATFEGWFRSQALDAPNMAEGDLETWRRMYDELGELSATVPKVGMMNFRPLSPGEYRYAVALREDPNLWLDLWVRRTVSECFVMVPTRSPHIWDVHASYHRDGTVHMKSRDRKVLTPNKRQPLTAGFKGCESLLTIAGFAPKSVGAVCDPTAFTGIVEINAGVLGPRDGMISVDLVEPGHQPTDFSSFNLVNRQEFRDTTPCLVISIWSGR